MKVPYIKLDEEALLPKYAHINDAGADVTMYRDVTIKKGLNRIPIGLKIILPPGKCVYFSPRSSYMGILQPGGLVPIDPDYSGEWHLCFWNNADDFVVKKGERLGQCVCHPFEQLEFVPIEEYEALRRGEGGLGSTGK